MKIIAMVPARMGSKRVPKKNIRYLGDKPLITHCIDAIKESNCFDEIYINSEDDIFKSICNNYGIKFYHRPEVHASDTATNDDFVSDFLSNIECDILIQILPTSPFITSDEIKCFVNEMKATRCNTLVSVKNIQISCLWNPDKNKNIPINFDPQKELPPSQDMIPISAYATSLMGWKSSVFIDNITKYGCAYHGPDGNTEYFELKGYSTVDIDNEEDFLLAEAIYKINKNRIAPKYYGTDSNE